MSVHVDLQRESSLLDFKAFITKNMTYGQFKLSICVHMGNADSTLRHDSASKYMHIIQLKSILAFPLK